MQLESKKEIKIDGKGLKVGLVVSRFNESITKTLLQVALAKLKESGVKDTKSFWVPRAVEIPYMLDKLAASKKYDCLVALGVVIRGGTPHFDYICKMASHGILRVSLDYHMPIGFGLLTLANESQAKARIQVAASAVLAALELAKIKV